MVLFQWVFGALFDDSTEEPACLGFKVLDRFERAVVFCLPPPTFPRGIELPASPLRQSPLPDSLQSLANMSESDQSRERINPELGQPDVQTEGRPNPVRLITSTPRPLLHGGTHATFMTNIEFPTIRRWIPFIMNY